MTDNVLVLKSINQLLNISFHIPSYQRGYRWTSKQVEQLLDDIWEFTINPPRNTDGIERPFYCLQPIVVRPRKNEQDGFEVIDGQQRLTTIFLVLQNLEGQIERDIKNFRSITYETRKGSELFLKQIDPELSNKNIDFFHIAEADKTIKNWFSHKANTTEFATPKAKLAPTFLTDTKVIWYEVQDTSESIDIFTRLNIGKIPLTNSELIKALFLNKANFKGDDEEKIRLIQLRIASEWDSIENRLQDDAFWHFLYNDKTIIRPKYPNRIEFIFDLLKGKKQDAEENFTFLSFCKDFDESRDKSNGVPQIGQIWLSVKRYFLIFDEWYRDSEFYHKIGYLVSIGVAVEDLLTLHSSTMSKRKFKGCLDEEIRQSVKCQLSQLEYNEPMIKKVLLLFNIQTILSNSDPYSRFPFDRYIKSKWDIEHVRSHTDQTIHKNLRSEWAKDILGYLTGKSNKESQIEFMNITKSNLVQLLNDLLQIAYFDNMDDRLFAKTYSHLAEMFNEQNEPEKAGLSNLALLDSNTNRSYKNAFFPIKRKVIMNMDKEGKFIPICTKNVFMKAYSCKLDEVMYWSKSDADDYMNAIFTSLSSFLPEQN